MSTWSNARSTFGQGEPATGAQYDNSGGLRQLQSGLDAASPGAKWSGTAATAYDAANTEHRRVIGRLAELDQRLSANVDQSAEVVAAGRQKLDEVRQWVQAAVASVPPGPAGEQMKLAIVQKGLAQMMDVVKTSNGDLNAIGAELRKLSDEYGLLGDQKHGKQSPPERPPEEPPRDQRLEEILEKYQVSEDPDGKITVDLPIIGEKTLTVSEAKLLAQAGPFGAYDIYQIQEQADAEAKRRFPGEDQHDNNADAFRHAYANALLVQRFGPEFAESYATAHERVPDNPAAVEAMDLYNNERGRSIGQLSPDASPEEIANQVEEAVRDGQMVVVGADGQGLSWSDQPDGHGGDSPPVPGEDPTTNPYPGY
jgi:hypothetical protein